MHHIAVASLPLSRPLPLAFAPRAVRWRLRLPFPLRLNRRPNMATQQRESSSSACATDVDTNQTDKKAWFLADSADARQQLTQFGAGALAGLVNTLVLSPLDVVKTRLQVQGPAGALPSRYRGSLHALKTMLREEGARAYYRGLSASVCAFVPNWAIYWGTYESCKRRYARTVRAAPSHLVHVLAALTAGAVTALTTAPFWTLKSRLQTDLATGAARRYRSVPQGLGKIFAEEGVSGLYKGLTPTLLGLGHVAVQFPLYEHLKSSFSGGRDEHLRPVHVLLASSISKIAASTLFYPHEVLRTKIQVDRTVARQFAEPSKVVKLAKQILKADGYTGFYRGFGANLLRTVPACMLTFSSYEFAKRFVESRANGHATAKAQDKDRHGNRKNRDHEGKPFVAKR